jgi:hypothetical protein
MNAIDVVKKDIKNIDKVILVYKEDLLAADELMILKDKRIDVANAEQSGWANYYHDKEVEIKHIQEYMQMKLQEVHGMLWTKYTEKMNIILSSKDKEEYIKHDPLYLNILEEVLKVNELHNQFLRVNKSFEQRGYVLNNLTRLIIASNNDWLIP